MRKRNVCVLFGGVSPEHEVSLRSAECILTNIDREKNDVFAVGITREGKWIYFAPTDYSLLPKDVWAEAPGCCPCVLSPSRGDGLILFTPEGVRYQPIDVVFPVLHGENGEDGSMQGLMQVAGLPCVGPHVTASATCMDKTMTKLMVDAISGEGIDYNYVLALGILYSALYIGIMLLVDIIYGILDPRIRVAKKRGEH